MFFYKLFLIKKLKKKKLLEKKQNYFFDKKKKDNMPVIGLFFKFFNLTVFSNKIFNKLCNFLQITFFSGFNVIIMDFFNNFNYLPITNEKLFSRSFKDFYKIIKFFNVNSVIFFDLNKKNFSFKKLSKFDLVSISLNKNILYNTDFSLRVVNNDINKYIIYLLIINLYYKFIFKN